MAVYHIESITIRDNSVIPVRVQAPAVIQYQSTNEVTGDREVVTYTGDALGVDESSYFLRMRLDDGTTMDLRNSDIVSLTQEYDVEAGSTIYWGTTTPDPSIGKIADVYFSKTGDCYSKTETGWVFQTNIRGVQGAAGHTPTIGDNDNWFIDGKDTGISARGEDGISGSSPVIDPKTKHWMLDGQDLGVCAEGITPHIGDNGNWFLGDDDTGVPAEGKIDPADLKALKNRLNSLIASKHSLGSCDYFFATSRRGYPYHKPTKGASLLEQLEIREGNMHVDDNYVTLRANRTYKITSAIMVDSTNGTNVRIWATDKNGTYYGSCGSGQQTSSGWSSVPAFAVVSFDEDTEVTVLFSDITGSTGSGILIAPTFCYVFIEEINTPKDIDPVEYIMHNDGIEDNPVGTIIPYMGTIVPKHYLPCDGAEYIIDDYPDLASHFTDEFGAAEYFGGDGITTFRVPDLRGEFLRGTGTADRDTGSGGEIGDHQDPTTLVYSGVDGNLNESLPRVRNTYPGNVDKRYTATGQMWSYPADRSTGASYVGNRTFTARPTNTSVLWCIKCKKTPFVQVVNNTLGIKLNDVIFDQKVTEGASYKLDHAVKDRYDEVKIYIVGHRSACVHAYTESLTNTGDILCVLSDYISDGLCIRACIRIVDDTVNIVQWTTFGTYASEIDPKLVILGIKYASAAGGTSGGVSDISKDPNNIIEEKPDGIFAEIGVSNDVDNLVEKKSDGLFVDVPISKEVDNALEKKTDGFYVENVPERLRLQVNLLGTAKHTTKEVQFFFATSNFDCNEHPELRPTLDDVTNIIALLPDVTTNMDVSDDKKYVRLLANRTYMVTGYIMLNSSTSKSYDFDIVDDNGVIYGARGADHESIGWSVGSPVAVITPEEDMWIGVCASIGKHSWTAGHTVKCATDFTYVFIQEINNQKVVDPVSYVMGTDGIEASPVGSIISYMGSEPPKHYLSCDGTEYNIADYPQLAQHFVDEFGDVSYFGGDGVDTFCVPDLRGEFLRGAGTADRDTGSGADIGEHQDGTIHPYSFGHSNGAFDFSENGILKDMDDTFSESSGSLRWIGTGYSSSGGVVADIHGYTSRPTNTSVNYCIKAEPTPFIQTGDVNVKISKDEGNKLEQREDGLYINNTSIEVSGEADNAIVQQEDGLYVAPETTYTDEEVEAAVLDIFYPTTYSRVEALKNPPENQSEVIEE